MKVLLLQPPVQDYYDTEVRRFPLGLCSLKAAVEARLPGVVAEVRDYRQGWGRRTVRVPPELAYLGAYYGEADRSPFSTFHGYYHFGAPFDVLAEEVAAARPDVIGIASLFSAYHREVLACAAAIRARCLAPVVVGGAHASAAPESLLGHPAVDYVIRGEGERPLVELLATLLGGGDPTGVPNLVFRRGRQVVHTTLAPNYPLAELPAPDPADLEVGRYRLGGSPLAAVVASRGCPRGCAFCSGGASGGAGHRRRPVAAVVAELRARYAEGYRAFDFEDDHLAGGPGDLAALCRAVIAAFPAGAVALHAMNGVSYLDLDPELLALMARAGFAELNLSLVSADPGSCRRMGRASAPARFAAVVAEASRLGLRTVGYQILGLPGEDRGATLQTLALLARLPTLVGASPFYLPPGAPLAEAGGPFLPADLVRCRLTALGPDGGDLTRDEVYTLLVAARIVNFVKGLPLAGAEASLGEALAAARTLGPRGEAGADALAELLAGGPLLAHTPRGLRPLPRFRGDLFRTLWARLGWITTRAGTRIGLGPGIDGPEPTPGRRAVFPIPGVLLPWHQPA